MLDRKKNYIVSGLERSGTSLMMQLLEAGGIPVTYDDSRKSNESNPKGYFELEGGKIINKLEKGEFNLNNYKGTFIKITSYGLRFLPMDAEYEVIYMMRNLDEILDSSIRMGATIPNKGSMRIALELLNMESIKFLSSKQNKNISYLPVFYNNLLSEDNQMDELERIKGKYPEFDMQKAKRVIDKKLYRNRK